MKNITNLDIKRHKLGLHKEASVFAILDIYKASGYKLKLELLAVITVLTHTEKTYSEVLNFIYKLEKVDSTESLLSKLSNKELDVAILVAKERKALLQQQIEPPANNQDSETPVSKNRQYLKNYKTPVIFISIFILFVISISFFSKTNAVPSIQKKPENIIYLKDNQGHKFIDVIINNTTSSFLLDTGASTTLISENYINQLISDGFIVKNSNYLGLVNVKIADGSKVIGAVWRLPFIKIGEIKLLDVEVIALENIDSSEYLLGMSTLKKLGNYTIVPNENKIIIKN